MSQMNPSRGAGGFGGDGHGLASNSTGQSIPDLDGLMRQVQAVLDDDSDAEVQQAMQQHYHDRAQNRPPMIAVLRMTALILHNVRVSGGRLSPRKALLLLACAGWDLALAQNRYRELGGSDDSSEENDEEDGEESGDSGSDDRFAVMRHINQHVDRAVAKRNQPDNSKLFIRIHHPNNKPDTTFTYPRQPVDWTQPVKFLNRWRSQILRRNLGPVRPFRTHFHADEKEWLFQEHLRFENQRGSQGLLIDYSAMRWGEIVTRFNHQFAGKVMPGESKPRPARTKVALRTERARIPKITRHTGIPEKLQRNPEASKSAKRVEEEDEEDEEEDEADYGPISTRRGDPPPGKPPRRDDDDDSGAGLGGRAWRNVVGVGG